MNWLHFLLWIAELYALGDCFAVGGEGHPRVTEDQWDEINALIDQAVNGERPSV